MKKCIVLLLILAAFPLFAQNSPSYYIYIPPVSGIGKSPEDNAFFAGSLAQKVTANNHFLTGNQNKADFIITPELGPMQPGQNPSDQLFNLYITLTDNKTNNILTEQALVYDSLEDADKLVSVAMNSIFSAIAVLHGDTNAWRNNWLYLGVSAFWTPRIHQGYDQSIQMANFGAGISAELHFLNYMSAELGAAFVPDWVGITDMVGNEYLDWILEVPLLVKFVFKPAAYYMIEPYGGIHANFPLIGVGRLPLFSWKAGIQYGVKAGPGIIFIDTCFSMDIGTSDLRRKSDNAIIPYRRYMINVGLGYKYGFMPRY